MSDELTRLEFVLQDGVGNKPLTSATVDLPTLRTFIEEVESLIKGDVPGTSLAGSPALIGETAIRVDAEARPEQRRRLNPRVFMGAP